MAHMSRGPLNALLSSVSGQWAVLGLGAVALLWPEQLIDTLQPAVRRLVDASNKHEGSTSRAHAAPIIIHAGDATGRAGGSGSGSGSLLTTLTSYAVGAGCVWVSYTVCSTCLPEYCKELFPVTRRFFDQVTTKLSEGIYQVKDVLGKQILNLSKQQEELGNKQDKTLKDVLDIKNDLGEARGDLRRMNDSIDRCEASLEDAGRLQNYTARGVRLLVRSVASILPENDAVTRDLLQYTKDGEAFRSVAPTTQRIVAATTMTPDGRHPMISPENEHPNGRRMLRQSSTGSAEDGATSSYSELVGMLNEGPIAVR